MGASLSRAARQLRSKPKYVRNSVVLVATLAWLLHYGLVQVAKPELYYQQLQAENWQRDRKRAARLVRSCRVLASRFWPLLFVFNGGIVMSMAAGSAWIRKKPPVFSHKVVIRTRDGGSLTLNIAPAAPATSSQSAFAQGATPVHSTAAQHSTHEECHWHTIIPDAEEKSPIGDDDVDDAPSAAPPAAMAALLQPASSADWLSATAASLARSASVPHLSAGGGGRGRLVSSTSMGALSAAESPTAAALGSGSPVLVMFPGNLGGMGSAYLFAAARLAHEKGWTAIIYERRGCGLNALTSPLTQNYADDDDVRLVMAKIKSMFPDSPLLAIGYSLGGNYLTRYIGSCGQRGEPPPFVAACVVANPFNLVGLSYVLKYKQKLSQWALLGDLRRVIRHNMHILNKHPEHKLDPTDLINMGSYRQVVTSCELKFWGSRHNAKCLDEYLLAGSSAYMLEHVQLPLLCITADDDPVSIPGLIPYEVFAKNPYLCLAKTRKGGHLGYVGLNPFGDNWSERASLEWLEVALLASS